MIKILNIKEQKDGSAIIEIEYNKSLEKLIAKVYNKKFTKKLLERFIIDGLQSYIKENK